MRLPLIRPIALAFICTLFLGGVAGLSSLAQQKPDATGQSMTKEQAAFYTNEIKPILQQNCLSCHSGAKSAGNLDLTKRENLLKGGVSGPAINLAKPEDSLLVKAINYNGRQMPPQGKMAPKTVEALTKWVQMGAPIVASSKSEDVPKHIVPPQVTPETMKFWSFQPVRRPRIPVVNNKEWGRSPIDAFVLKRLESAQLTPNPPAARAALIRRATYDLTGLPPAPAEVRAFIADKSPNAYEKLVDRLLASPQYGEKWGRHWLDLVHFAETNSYERDGVKPNAWRYRDYVINAFTQDKPYNQFVTEQLAGDEMPNRSPEHLIATGYYRLGIWDDEPSDPAQALYDDMDDIASTTGQVFLGLTVGCARCHDHKIDPIPQKDYYSFLSFFGGVNRYSPNCQRPIAPEDEVKKQRAEIQAHELKVRANLDAITALENKVTPDFAPVEQEEFRTDASRIPIVRKRIGKLISQEEFDRYLALKEEARNLKRFQPTALDMALCVTEDPQPRETHVLLRGNPHVEGDKVEPAFLSVLNPPKLAVTPPEYGDSCGRRLALANWIASPQNPLTARVMVNRIWQYHFGSGLVRTPSNFGFQGSKPTHPELLDWLASEFVAQGWKLKPLHRMIMLSSTYRMSAASNPNALAKDPENNLLWRYDMRRLEGEEVRDSILAINGTLNLERGGPGVFPEIPAAVLAGQSRPGDGWGKSSEAQRNRRSVYIHVKRSLITPMIASFDGPETDFTCPVRFATTQPTQALGMLNSEFINKEAHIFAAFLKKQAGSDAAAQVKLGLSRVLQREPSAKEIARGVTLITALQQKDHASADEALASFCVVALNLNEFLYLE